MSIVLGSEHPRGERVLNVCRAFPCLQEGRLRKEPTEGPVHCYTSSSWVGDQQHARL